MTSGNSRERIDIIFCMVDCLFWSLFHVKTLGNVWETVGFKASLQTLFIACLISALELLHDMLLNYLKKYKCS